MLIHSNGAALQRAVLSPDGKSLAVIAPDQRVHLINLAEAIYGRRFINGIKVPRATRPFLKECSILRWSPESVVPGPPGEADEVLSNTTSECDLGVSWLLLSNGTRLIALSTDLRSPRMMPGFGEESEAKSNILADYELGGQFGELSLVEFVFNHRHALVMFKVGTSATILSLTKPQREEVAHIKFPDSRSLATSTNSKYFALLRRQTGQDKVTVFELGEGNKIKYRSFNSHTNDAQSVEWCPAGSPVMAVLDSSSYGAKVSFFTAQGHALRQLDISSSTFLTAKTPTIDPEDVGLTHWKWMQAGPHDHGRTVQAMANGKGQVVVRYQSTSSISTSRLTSLTHGDVIDGTKTFTWQETTSPTDTTTSTFTRQTSTFEAAQTRTEKASEARDSKPAGQLAGQVAGVFPNANHSILATRLHSSPRTLFLWKPTDLAGGNAHPHTVLVFLNAIRQTLWHPTLPNVLLVLTASRSPVVYAWYQESLAPVSGVVPMANAGASTNFSASWLAQCTRAEDRRCPFMLTCTTAFEVGYLESVEGRVVYESVTRRDGEATGRDMDKDMEMEVGSDEDLETGLDAALAMDTPSRPSKTTTKTKTTRFDVEADSTMERESSPLHVQAKARYGFQW